MTSKNETNEVRKNLVYDLISKVEAERNALRPLQIDEWNDCCERLERLYEQLDRLTY